MIFVGQDERPGSRAPFPLGDFYSNWIITYQANIKTEVKQTLLEGIHCFMI